MKRASLLLVNGSTDERELYAWGLPLHGLEVRTVDSPRDVPHAIEQLRPDVMVLSLKLGDDHTWELLEQMQCGAGLDVPGVLLTGSIRPDAANRDRATTNGCAAFVAKPCTPGDLAAILRAVMAGARGVVITDPSRFASGDVHLDPHSG